MGGITAASGGRNVESGDLLSLQARMKKDPSGYQQELVLQLRHFDACVSILMLKSSSSVQSLSGPASTGDAGAAKEVADVAMFLAHMAPFYPQYLKDLPQKLLQILNLHATLPQTLRRSLTQAVILTRNRKLVDLVDLLPVLMDLQCSGDRVVRKLAFLHIVHDIRRMNLKHKNEPVNRKLQTVVFNLVQGDDEVKSKRALIVLAELYRRKVWIDERTANTICTACLHKSSRIMIASLRFLLGYDQQKDEEDGEESDSDAEEEGGKPSAPVNREAIYKAYHKGTVPSKKKKQNKLQRAIRSMQKQQRAESREMEQGSHAPLQHVVDPQSFAEKLFARLKSCNERFEVKLMIMQVISRVIGIHRLMLLNFYPFLQKYIEPHQRDVTLILAAAVQACHDLVPPDAVESMVRQLVNHFVHDRARPEVIAVGLNVMREICIRIPLIMTAELLTDLALYKKNREKAVAAAARSIISVYRQLWPSLLEKKDRGRNADLSAKPKEFGATSVATGVPGVELLLEEDNESEDYNSESEEDKTEASLGTNASEEDASGEEANGDDAIEGDASGGDATEGDGSDVNASEDEASDDEGMVDSDFEGSEEEQSDEENIKEIKEERNDEDVTLRIENSRTEGGGIGGNCEGEGLLDRASKKRRTSEPTTDEISNEQSLRTLKKLSAAKEENQKPALMPNEEVTSKEGDGILSNEDFEHIRSLQQKRAAKTALAASGLTKAGKRRREVAVKLSDPESLSGRRLDPSVLEANVRKHREKEERVAMAKAGREDRMTYCSRTATKQRKTGGLSNREKEKRKAMPLGAVRSKVARNKQWKKKKGSGKNQFRGKKAWKS
ncbi:unnamed protein product [Calypogeia fissa]